jgi:hypothetical protein
VVVPVPPETAFDVSETTGDVRLRWDPFIRRQQFLGGATSPAKGVETLTVHRLGLRMVSRASPNNRPTNVWMRMVRGSWFFARLGGGWRFSPVEGDPGSTWPCGATTSPVAERIGSRMLQRDIDPRIAGFARRWQDVRSPTAGSC